MNALPPRPLHGLGYTQARRLLVAAGIVILGAIAAVMYARRVETVEVVAVLLFVPVYLALLRWDLTGGVLAGSLASAAYVVMRGSAIQAVGAGRLTGLVVSRTVGFLVFGALGGWANRHLKESLTKLDLYDQIDDDTGLFNARYFVQDTDLEMARARRYRSVFSVSLADFPAASLDGLSRRARDKLLSDLGSTLRESIRLVDRAVHCQDGDRHRVAVILPETGPEGARVFSSRLAVQLGGFLAGRGARVGAADVEAASLTYPDDDERLHRLRAQFAAIDHVEHPEAPEPMPTP